MNNMVELIYFGTGYGKNTLFKIVDGKRQELGEFYADEMLGFINENFEYARLICGSERV